MRPSAWNPFIEETGSKKADIFLKVITDRQAA
jgi:hypothetical protein